MTLVNNISLLFAFNNKQLELISSSANTCLDKKVSQKAGAELQRIIKQYSEITKKPIDLSKVNDLISVKMVLKDKNYQMELQLPGQQKIAILLNEAFTAALSGTSSLIEKKAPPPPAQPIPQEQPRAIIKSLPSSPSKVTSIQPIENPGSDCFMNSIFQVIMQDEILRKALVETYQTQNTPKAKAFCKAIQDYSEGKTIFTTALRDFMPADFKDGQQDAFEFLQCLLNDVSSDKHPDVFASLKTTHEWELKNWWGAVTEQTTTSVTAKEFFINLEVPSQRKAISGQALIQKHFEKKPHAGDNYTNNGKEYTPGTEHIEIVGTPKRLTFLLKRFLPGTKIDTAVDMPETVVINGHTYALKKIVNHHGITMRSGHYTSSIQTSEGKWIRTSDHMITPAKNIQADRQSGYIYFYDLVK